MQIAITDSDGTIQGPVSIVKANNDEIEHDDSPDLKKSDRRDANWTPTRR